MESNNSTSILIKQKDNLLTGESSENTENTENTQILDMICNMAFETEGKTLSRETVAKAMERLFDNPMYGHYFLIIDNLNQKFSGMNMVTYEYIITEDKILTWIQSVYVCEEYRMKGLFRKLLETNENFVRSKDDFHQSVKLYMDKDNSKAEQVYLKVGFKITNESMYEVDYNFDDIKFLENNTYRHLDLNENSSGYKVGILSKENNEIINLMGEDKIFRSLINENSIHLRNCLTSIYKILNDYTLGKLIYIYEEKTNRVIGAFLIFHEFSDWRNSIFWCVNDFIINEDDKDFVITNIERIIYTLVKLNYDSQSCGLRFMATPLIENLLKRTLLIKSNYVIYEKKLN